MNPRPAGTGRQPFLIRGLAAFAAMALVILTAASGPAQDDTLGAASPPAEYHRLIIITVMDANQTPLPDVEVELNVEWGRLIGENSLTTGAEGRVEFEVEPVIEEAMAGVKTKDRFLNYRLALTYKLSQPGRTPRQGRIEDEQEFAAFADPLYQGLNREPTDEPLTLTVLMPRYRDYLADPDRLSDADVKVLDRVLAAADSFSLEPGSYALTTDGVFRLGLKFELLFDPTQYGLRGAGAALLLQPVRDALRAASGPETARVSRYVFTAAGFFQYRDDPLIEPARRDFVFSFPAEDAAKIISWKPEQPLVLEGLRAQVEGKPLDLKPELAP